MSVDDGGGTLTFEDFFRDQYPRLVPVLQALTGDRGLAEDLAQESFAKAQRDWDRIARYDRPGAWVRRVALNCTAFGPQEDLSDAAAPIPRL